MIEKLVLRNFQCHKKKTLEFGNVTTITGPSDAGKSAIVRALRWVLLNKPNGKGVVHRGQSRCSAVVAIDGRKIKKVRKGAKTTYYLDDAEFKAFGNNVPDAIVVASAIGEDNIQKQHDPPFWLALSSGELSRALNEVVDLSAIDTTIQTLNKWLRRASTEAEVAESRLAALRSKRKELSFVKDMDADWKIVEKLVHTLDASTAIASRVEQLLAVADTTQRSLNMVRKPLNELTASLLEAVRPAKCVARDRKTVHRVKQAIAAYGKQSSTLKATKDQLAGVEKQLAKFKNCPLCGGKLT